MQHDATLTPSAPQSAAGGILLRSKFPSNYESVRVAIADAKSAMSPLDISDEEATSVELLLAEALNNIVEHAYGEETEGEIRMVLRHGRAGVLIEIRDDGKPMPNGRAPIGDKPFEEGTSSDDAPEGGFGWFLIRELARDLIYDRIDNENFLVFRLAIGKR